MKKYLSILLVLILSISSLFAATVSLTPAATVNLIRNTRITVDQLNNKITELGATVDQALDVLNIMINDELFLQGAERAGITINENQLNNLYSSMKTNIEHANGVTLTNEEFEQLVVTQYGSVDKYKQYLKEQYILESFLMKEKGEKIQNTNFNPTSDEVNTFFRRNRTSFIQADNIYFAHIYIAKKGDANDSANKALLQKVEGDIRSGSITFENAVKNYTEDKESIPTGGIMGVLTSDNSIAREGWGDSFVDKALSLEVGVPTFIESNTGYHIVKVISYNDAKMLNIDDRIDPTQAYTVRDYITEYLANQNYQVAISSAINEIIASLKEEASIRILYK